jgi:hypothetical protein
MDNEIKVSDLVGMTLDKIERVDDDRSIELVTADGRVFSFWHNQG